MEQDQGTYVNDNEQICPSSLSAKLKIRKLTNSFPKEQKKELSELKPMKKRMDKIDIGGTGKLDYEIKDQLLRMRETLAPFADTNRVKETTIPMSEKLKIDTEISCTHIVLGPCGTKIPYTTYSKIHWTNPQAVTRNLLHIIFSDEVLATHIVSDDSNPLQLDPKIIRDIVICVKNKVGGTEQLILATISAKCEEMYKKLKKNSLENRF